MAAPFEGAGTGRLADGAAPASGSSPPTSGSPSAAASRWCSSATAASARPACSGRSIPGTLFFDLEAGDLADRGLARRLDPAPHLDRVPRLRRVHRRAQPGLPATSPYGRQHYDAVRERFGDPAVLDRYETVFIDSITVASRLCFAWAQGQPEAFSEKTGKPDLRGAYGLHGRETDRLADPPAAHARQERLVRRDPRREASTTSTAGSSCRRSRAPRPASSCRASSTRSSRWPSCPARGRQALSGLRLPDPEPLGLPGEGPQRPARHDREPHLGRLMAKIRGPCSRRTRGGFGRPASRDAATPPRPSQA